MLVVGKGLDLCSTNFRLHLPVLGHNDHDDVGNLSKKNGHEKCAHLQYRLDMGCGRVDSGKDAKEDKLCNCTTYGTDNKDSKEPLFCFIKSVKLETGFNENSCCNDEKDKCDSKRPQIRHNCPL